ncbi:MAG: hypothetical protein AUG49_07570 [Catenulispora sp. 13_1_20CM_3_70_7]|nr:MAG: hypothetical protein AUG49_07570 [Catenulispora sp. 13_1_20CM_3_70_7]
MTGPTNHPCAYLLARLDELQARLQRVEKHLAITGHPHADPATPSRLDRAENAERVRTMLREWNGYDSTPEEEAEADAQLNAMVGRIQP